MTNISLPTLTAMLTLAVLPGPAAGATMTCPQLVGFAKIVEINHVATVDPKLRAERLTRDHFARALREDFTDDLDPLKQFVLAREAEPLTALDDQTVRDAVFARGDCRAFEAAHARYLAGVNRSLRLWPPGAGEDAGLRAGVEAIIAGWGDVPPDAIEARLRRADRPRTVPELIANARVALALLTYHLRSELGGAPATARREAFDTARELYDDARRRPIARDAVPRVMAAAILGRVDAHSQYYAPTDYGTLRTSFAGRYSGIGVTLGPAYGGLHVRGVIANGPAARGGEVRAWDKIIAIDGRALDTVGALDAVQRIVGADGTEIRLTITREGRPAPFDVVLVRAPVTQSDRSVTATLERDENFSALYVKLTSFGDDVSEAVASAIKAPEARNVDGIVLDLRGNPGGIVSEATNLVQLFEERAPRNALYLRLSSGAKIKRVALHRGAKITDRPLVVLVDRHSASAAELVAGALQAYGRAIVVGNSPTFGKGTTQFASSIFLQSWLHPSLLLGYVRREAPPGAMFLTFGFYYLPDGQSIQNVGVRPDILLYPERAFDANQSEAHLSAYSLPRPTPLAADAIPARDRLSLFARYAAQIAPTRARLAAEFDAQRARILERSPEDPERAAALHLLKNWTGSR